MTTLADLAVKIEMPVFESGGYDAETQRQPGPVMRETQGTQVTLDYQGKPNDSNWDTDS